MPHRPVANAFGHNSLHWNVAFPDGNLTAAEIAAYCPHWLKSIDVIDRFVTNGIRSSVIAIMINDFREQPDEDKPFASNSVCITMQDAMRRAGFPDWVASEHPLHRRINDKSWDEGDLSVASFRCPRITHPRGGDITKNHNEQWPAVPFATLAQYVKRHPSGADALDLTRCILYALENPEEEWMFPDDYTRLISKLGGPMQVTRLHHDKQVFARHDPKAATSYKESYTYSTPQPRRRKQRNQVMSSAPPKMDLEKMTPMVRKRSASQMDDDGSQAASNKRRSGRLANKATVDFSAILSDVDSSPTLRKSQLVTQARSKLLNNCAKVAADDDDDAFKPSYVTSSSDSSNNVEVMSDDSYRPPRMQPERKSAREARQSIRDYASLLEPSGQKPVPNPIDPALMDQARAYHDARPKPLRIPPPVLDRNRITIDSMNVWTFAAEGVTDPWPSALSSDRPRGGPRQSPPFRELYRLSDPPRSDRSDWAENIRWAKQQMRFFDSVTWTEYYYHLEQITQHRRDTSWVSDELMYDA